MEDTQAKIQKLQMIEERLNQYNAQKQQLQAQRMEFESSIKALDGAKTAHRIIGTIMVEQSTEEIIKKVTEDLEELQVRLDSVTNQEKKLRDEAATIQEEISSGMKKQQEQQATEQETEQTSSKEE